MGEYVSTISRVSKWYNLYIIVIANKYGNTAQEIINKLFEQIAHDIGENNIISKVMTDSGISEAEKMFNIKYNDVRPILIITEKHPSNINKDDDVIKIKLGNFGSEDEIKNFLFELVQLIGSQDFGAIQWEMRKRKIIDIAKKVPYVEIIKTAIGHLKP